MRGIKNDIVKVRYEIKVTTKIFTRDMLFFAFVSNSVLQKPYNVSKKCRSLVILPFTKAIKERATLS
jgi:hypothetical protein